MADIQIKHEHSLDASAARQAAEQMAGKLSRDYGMQHQWAGDRLSFTRPGINGEMELAAGSVLLSVSLGFLLRPMAGEIEARVRRGVLELFPAT